MVACRRAPLGPTILSHMTHRNRTLRDSERRPGVPSGRRRPDVPSHRGPIVGWCHATGTWLAIALPCPLGHAPLIRLCCPLLLHSYTIISSRGLPLLPFTDNWTLSIIRLSVVISRHEPHFCCKIIRAVVQLTYRYIVEEANIIFSIFFNWIREMIHGRFDTFFIFSSWITLMSFAGEYSFLRNV